MVSRFLGTSVHELLPPYHQVLSVGTRILQHLNESLLILSKGRMS